MPLHYDPIIQALADLSKEKDFKVAVNESIKGGLLTGVTAILGGLLLGPVGLALGGAIGGTAAAMSSKQKFQSLCTVILNLPERKKKLLCENIKFAFKDFGIQDVVLISTLILQQKSFQDIALREVSKFLKNDMNLQIQNLGL